MIAASRVILPGRVSDQQARSRPFRRRSPFLARLEPPTTEAGAELGAPGAAVLNGSPPVHRGSGTDWVGGCVAGESRRPSD